MFYTTIQKGIDSVTLPKSNSICLYFMKSKFVLILDTENLIIKTIRDGNWKKPSNKCKNILITNETILSMQSNEIDYLNNNKYFKIKEVTENFDLILESNCEICLQINF